MIATASLILLGLACLWLAWIDVRGGVIPDRLNLLVAATGVVRQRAATTSIPRTRRSSPTRKS
jgi:hypothetical protein